MWGQPSSEAQSLINTADLSHVLGTLHGALDRIVNHPRDEPMRLSLEDAKRLLPTDIVHFCLVLELVRELGFSEISVEAPRPSFLGVYLWRIGLWDLFPDLAPRRPIREPPRGSTERFVELTRFTDLAGAYALGQHLPDVLTSARGAAEVVGGVATLKRLSNAVFEIAENTAAHSRRLHPEKQVIGYAMAQRMPRAEQTFIALGDVGDGIPATIRARHEVGTDLEAIELAMVPGVSGSDGGGNGLGRARQATTSLPGGAMTIESGGALLRLRASGAPKTVEFEHAWPATRVSFYMKI
jgi:hypothetical protein